MSHVLSRQELYDLVWAEPMKTLSKRFGISDVALAKTCRKSHIPVPPRGYWAKLAAGKRVTKLLLPKRGLAQSAQVHIGGSRFNYRGPTEEEILTSNPQPPIFEEDMDAVRAAVQRKVGKVSVPRDPRRGHREVVKLLEVDDQRRQKQAQSSYVSDWDAPYFGSKFELRRLRVINALFLALAWHGARPYCRGKQAQECGFSIGDNYVGFSVDSPSAEKLDEHRWQGAPRKIPKNESLVVRIQSHREDRIIAADTETEPVERKLRQVVVDLLVQSEQNYRAALLHHYQWDLERKTTLEKEIIRRAEETRLEEERQIAAERKARIDELLAQADAFRRAADIRAYVEAAQHLASNMPGAELEEWGSWARARADELDPVVNGTLSNALQR